MFTSPAAVNIEILSIHSFLLDSVEGFFQLSLAGFSLFIHLARFGHHFRGL
jgi:hypothetical protein